MGVTINLDTSALSRLFNDLDEKTVLHIKQAVLEETCRRRIKAIVKEDVIGVLDLFIREEVKNEIGEITGQYCYNTEKIKISPKIAKELKAQVRQEVKKLVTNILKPDTVTKMVEEAQEFIMCHVRGEISLYLNGAISSQIEREVKNRLQLFLNTQKQE